MAQSSVENPAWASGQAASLQAGVEAARQRGHDAVVVGLGDQPMVPSEAWSAVAAAQTAPLPSPRSMDDEHHLPGLLGSVWSLLPRDGDEGARVLMQARPDLVQEVPCDGYAVDIDTRGRSGSLVRGPDTAK